MSDNTNKFKNFLVNGFQGLEPRIEDDVPDEGCIEEDTSIEAPAERPAEVAPSAQPVAEGSDIKELESELIRIRFMLEDLVERQSKAPEMPDMSDYLTTRAQNKAITATIQEMEMATSNKKLLHAMEQISVMREDFFRLCQGMRERIDKMDAQTVLSSFEAYEVDMENILTDAGVYIGKFDFERLNTLHQRIVGVVPTDEKEKDGTIAERQTDGYKLGDKVLMKEKVTVYKYAPSDTPEEASKVETSCETDSETICTTDAQESGHETGSDGSMEEKE